MVNITVAQYDLLKQGIRNCGYLIKLDNCLWGFDIMILERFIEQNAHIKYLREIAQAHGLEVTDNDIAYLTQKYPEQPNHSSCEFVLRYLYMTKLKAGHIVLVGVNKCLKSYKYDLDGKYTLFLTT